MAMPKGKKILIISACTVFGLILLLTTAYHIALSSRVICSYWLLMAGKMTRSTMTASEVKVSILRSSLEVKDFCYANGHGVELRADSLKTGIAFFPLFSKDIRIQAPALRGVNLKLRPAEAEESSPQMPVRKPSPNRKRPVPAAVPASREARIPLMEKPFRIPESLLGWKELPFKLALRDLSIHDLTVDYADAGGVELFWSVDSLVLNRITPGMTSELQMESLLRGSLKTYGIEKIVLPLSLSCRMLPDSVLFPETVDLSADFQREKHSPLLVLPPDRALAPEKTRFLLHGRRANGKWTLEQALVSTGKSSLKASGELEPRLNSASFAWTLKLYPAQLPRPLPELLRNSGMEISFLEENGKLSFLNGKLEYSDILSASGFKLDEKGTPVGKLGGAMNYIVSADIPGGMIGLSNAMLDLSEGETELLTLQSRTPLKFYRTRDGFFPDPDMVPDFQFRMRETPLPKLNMFLKGGKFRKGVSALTATATTDAKRNILVNASLSVRDQYKGRSAAEIALSASLDLAGTTRPDSIRISSSCIDLPLLREILPEEVVPAVPLAAGSTSRETGKTASVQESVPAESSSDPSPSGEKAVPPAQEKGTAGRLPSFLRDENILLTLDLRAVHCGDGADLALSGDLAFRDQVLTGKNLLLRINGTTFPLRFESDLAKERFQVSGMTRNLNAGPWINLLLRQKSASLTVDSLKFDLSGEGFTPERMKRSLTGSFVTRGSGISVPLELDQSSGLLQLVMIPLESIPSLLGMIGGSELKNLALEKTQGLASVLNGSTALSFNSANLDASIRNGVVTFRDLTLSGDLILAETLSGTVDLASGEINLKTRTNFDIITIPLNFGGTISSPAPDFPGAIADFLKVNASATLRKTVDRLLNNALNTAEDGAADLEKEAAALDKAIDKGIQKGLRGLGKWLNHQNNQK